MQASLHGSGFTTLFPLTETSKAKPHLDRVGTSASCTGKYIRSVVRRAAKRWTHCTLPAFCGVRHQERDGKRCHCSTNVPSKGCTKYLHFFWWSAKYLHFLKFFPACFLWRQHGSIQLCCNYSGFSRNLPIIRLKLFFCSTFSFS